METLEDEPVPGPTRDYVGYGRDKPAVEWPDGANLALNFVINYEEGSEYAIPAGDGENEALPQLDYEMDPEYRDLAAESVHEYGSRAGIWRLLDLFDEYDVQTTFFACAVALQRNPEVGARIREAGHEPCSHGWRWSEHWRFDREEERKRIQWAIDGIEETCGQRPRGWYCRYGPSVNTRELLVEEGGFTYDSDAYNDDLPYVTEVDGTDHLVIPYSLTYNDFRIAAQGVGGPSSFVDCCKRGLDEYLKEGRDGRPKMMSIGLHPRLMGQAGRTSALREVIEYANAQGDVWFARRIDIAEWWLDHHQEFT